mgnify:FL=1
MMGNGDTTFTGKLYMTAAYENSDERRKNIIEQLDDVFFSYTLKEDNDKIVRYGTVAQHIEKTLPEVVETDNDGYKSVNYTSLLVNELSKAKAKIAEQEERLNSLEKKIDALIANLN